MPKVSDSSNQIPLDFKDKSVKTFKDFVIGNNQSIVESLNSFLHSEESLFFLWGESGSGKSHLLQAFINSITIDDKKAAVLDTRDLSNRENVSLIEMFDVVCIDNVQEISGESVLEEALFFWINEIRQAQKKIILAGDLSNKSALWQLPDLRSRLQSGRTHELRLLDRKDVINVFNKQASDKGIVIDKRVSSFLETNCPMNLGYLSKLLTKLDEITLVEKKQVTIPLLKTILETKLVN